MTTTSSTDLPGELSLLAASCLTQDREHAILLLDPSGHIVNWLGAAERIFGYTPDEAIGQPLAMIFTAEDRDKKQPQQELDVAREAGHSEDDRWHVRSDGAALWMTGALTRLHGADGAVIGYAKVVRDRTDLRMQVETLENRVAGLQAKHETTSRFLATLGHELKTPLTNMLMATEVLESRNADSALADTVGMLRRQVSAVQRFAEDLVDLCRIDLGRLQLRTTSFSLQSLATDGVANFAERARQADRKLSCIMPDAPIALNADRERIQQVLNCLIENAFRYTRPGGHIVVRALSEPPDVVVRVEDDGVGIDPAALPLIFDLFTRGGDTQLAPEGLGIGLAVARQIIEMHAGTLEARSNGSGQGAIFSLRIPSRIAAERATAP